MKLRSLIPILLLASAFAQSPWPGQASNLVGYAAYGTLNATACGAITSGSAGSPTIIQNCTFTGTGLTISQNHVEFISVDFNEGTGGINITGASDTFIGCRFQSNNVANQNIQVTGGTNITFLYSSVVPLASLAASPPGSVWPTAGSGSNSTTITSGVNALNGNNGYQYGFNLVSGGPVYIDSADIWGFGNAVVFYNTTAQMTLANSWIHDIPDPAPQGYHTDGPGYLNGGTGPNNVLMSGNVIAMLGNTNSFAFQAATGGYSGINAIENYFSGNGFTLSPGDIAPTHFTNSALIGNVLGTDVMPGFGAFHGTTLGSNTVWACNTIAFRAGTSWTASSGGWTPTSGMNGQFFVLSNSPTNSATDQGGNTKCVLPSPSSLDFVLQSVNVPSTAKTITLTNTNSATVTISSIALTTGTQFAISNNTCAGTIAASATCSFQVKFTPTSQEMKSDTVTVTTDMPAPASTNLVIPVVGVGSNITPQASAPTFTPSAPYSGGATSVTITCATGPVACYANTNTVATDGATGCTSGTKYTAPIVTNVTTTYYAVCGGTGFTDSAVTGPEVYTISAAGPDMKMSGLTVNGLTVTQ